MTSKIFFTQLVERFLNQRLQKYKQCQLTSDILGDIYADINTAMLEIFSQCEFNLTDKSKKYVSETLFKGLAINEIDDLAKNHVLLSRITPRDLPNNDISLLMSLFEPSIIYDELEEESRRRK